MITPHSANDNRSTPRLECMNNWLEEVISDSSFRVESLAGDASFRRYHRIYLPSDTVYILMDAPPEKESLIEFIAVAELMADNVNVPDIIAKDIPNGFLLLQDFGTVEFAHLLVDATDEDIDGYYQQAMNVLKDIQNIPVEAGKKAGLPDYDQALLLKEMALFTEYFLPYVGVQISSEFEQAWTAFNTALVREIEQQPQVVVHRDYHSRNLMQDKNANNPLGVIDFQDAVIGAYSYDVASLVRDAYVDWEEGQINQWLADFHQLLATDQDFTQFLQDVIVMGVQRHLKVLGIFVRLAVRDGKIRYLADIPKVMNDLLYELTWLKHSAKGDIQALASNFLTTLEAEVLPSYLIKFQ